MSEQTKPIDQMTDAELNASILKIKGWKSPTQSDRRDLWIHPTLGRCEPTWYVGDLNCAKDLLAEMPNHVLIWHDYYESWAIQEVTFEEGAGRDFETRCVADTPARAICEAWVEWKRGE